MRCPICDGSEVDENQICCNCANRAAGQLETAVGEQPNYTPAYLKDGLLAGRDTAAGERKPVSVLFCDMVGSTALAQAIGAERMHDLLNRFFELSLGCVHRYGGTINQFLGDGFMALFGAPASYEDHALRAVLAALEIQQRIPAAGLLAEAGHEEIHLRVGINSGTVVIGSIGDELRSDYTAIGDVTHIASRLQVLAAPGTILVGEDTYRAVAQRVDCRSKGAHRVKGYAGSIATYEVVSQRPDRRHRTSSATQSLAYVGRTFELGLCAQAVARVGAGEGVILGITGEAGLGKSRLLEEMKRLLPGTGARCFEGHAVSFGRSLSLWPFLEIIRQCFDVGIDDAEEFIRGKLARELSELFGDSYVEVLPYFATLLSIPVTGALAERVRYLDGIAMGQQVYRAVLRLFEKMASERPLIVILEDWHWADQSSRALLKHLLPLVTRTPVLFALVWRTEAGSQGSPVEMMVRELNLQDSFVQVALTPLDDGACIELSRSLLGAGELAPALREIVLPKAGGNPLYLVEMLRALVAHEAIVCDRVGETWHTTEAFDAHNIPATVQGMILSRIDRLEDGVRQVLKTASVIGRAFFYRVLAAVSEHGSNIDRALRALQDAELVIEHRALPELEYAFRHPLIREATYETILSSRRRYLHLQVAEAIEFAFEGRAEDHCAVLAYHYARAEVWEKTHHYLLRAGDRAATIAADTEALEHYQQAQVVYARALGDRWDPVQRATLSCRMAEAMFRQGTHDRAAEQFQHALKQLGHSYPAGSIAVTARIVLELARHVLLSARSGRDPDAPRLDAADHALMHRIYLGLSMIDFYVEPRRFALDVLAGINWAIRAGALNTIAQGYAGFSIISATLGAWKAARFYSDKAARLGAASGDASASTLAGYALAHAQLYSGDWAAAEIGLIRAIEAYRVIGLIREHGLALVTLIWIKTWQGQFEQVRPFLTELRDLGAHTGDRHLALWTEFYGAIELARRQSLERAAEVTRRAMDALITLPDYLCYVEGMGQLAMYAVRQGETEQALALLDEADTWIRRKGSTPHLRTAPCLAQAWVRLRRAGEESTAVARKAQFGAALEAARNALRLSETFAGAAPQAWCVLGSVFWLKKRHRAARQAWARGLAAATRLSSTYELGVVQEEIAYQTNDARAYSAAKAAFEAIGATVDLQRLEARAMLTQRIC